MDWMDWNNGVHGLHWVYWVHWLYWLYWVYWVYRIHWTGWNYRCHRTHWIHRIHRIHWVHGSGWLYRFHWIYWTDWTSIDGCWSDWKYRTRWNRSHRPRICRDWTDWTCWTSGVWWRSSQFSFDHRFHWMGKRDHSRYRWNGIVRKFEYDVQRVYSGCDGERDHDIHNLKFDWGCNIE
jgi:hypothetical protein